MMSKTCHCIYKQKLIKCQRKILSRSCPASAGLFLREEVDCWPCSPLHGHGQAPVRHGAAIKKRRIQFVFTKLKQKFQDNPKFYYAMSIAASWAGAGSLMNSTTLANTLGVIPSLIWCVCNTLACIVFGLVIWYLPTVRRVMKTKVCRAVLAIFSIFQIWLCMTAINEAWAATSFGPIAATAFTYAVTAAFIIALFKYGIIPNIMTDNGGMLLIYLLVIVLSGVSLVATGGKFKQLSLGLGWSNMSQGIYKGLLLLPGPFTYPYFFKLIDYNEQNDDGVSKCDIIRAFVLGGIGFGIYLAFAFSLIFTEVSPVLTICKAVLLSALAISSLSSFIYSEYAVFGRKIGLGINAVAILFWILVAPLGVMGVWTLMAESRVYLIVAMIAAAAVLRIRDKRKRVQE